MNTSAGTVYIVGAGPGDPELITVKAQRILKKADCILYDFLASSELLTVPATSCEKICVGKADGMHLQPQDEINRLLVEKAYQYNVVVRLKGGDPLVFSRGIEEARYLERQRIPFEIIQGITSAFAAPESFGIPLTIKGTISSVAVLTGRKHDINALIDVPACNTLVYLMGVSNIGNIVKALRSHGRSDETPCAFIEKATTRHERIVHGTIGTIEEICRTENVNAPAVLIIGEVLHYAVTGNKEKTIRLASD